MHYYPAICHNTGPTGVGRRPSPPSAICRIRQIIRMRLLALNKPFGTICQFSPHETRASLADWVKVPGVYPAGRLDSDSEGLLLLTDDGALQARIAEPRHKLIKRYWAQVEGAPGAEALKRLTSGVDLGDYVTRPCQARIIEPSEALWSRNPPIRFRAAIPTTWIELSITEGKNRQVRRMTAAVGFPTLRLVRAGIGALDIFALGLEPGASRKLPPGAPWDGMP
jgi:23S rRNA pseudouridine2457 synthase